MMRNNPCPSDCQSMKHTPKISRTNKVSPIKIVGGRNIVKAKINTKDVSYSPVVHPTSNTLKTAIADNCLNYSIVESKESSCESPQSMKIKLRVSQRCRPSPCLENMRDNPLSSPNKSQAAAKKNVLVPNTNGNDKSDCSNKYIPSKVLKHSQRLKSLNICENSPILAERKKRLSRSDITYLEQVQANLHVSVVPDVLPCREKEFNEIYLFLKTKIRDRLGGCMYVSGLPGTGKTATVTGVIRKLRRDTNEFDFLEINGMRLSEPHQAYVEINKQLTGKAVPWEHAQRLLNNRFTKLSTQNNTTILMVDELDILCNRRQDVIYNILDWPTKMSSRLVVITIANTMDLPERVLMGKVTSRLGLTRLTFQPYSHKQLQEIITARLNGDSTFKNEAIQLAARKVAAVSGDARRALDICRRATEIAGFEKSKWVNISHIQVALGEMIASPNVQALQSCSELEKMVLQAVVAEVTRIGIDETQFLGVYSQLESIAAFSGMPKPSTDSIMRICSKLASERILICEQSRADIFQRILLNVSTDDIHYALRTN